MSNSNIIYLKDFSLIPFGRYKSDGPHSGEEFRKDRLLNALNEFDKVTVILDDIEVELSSSFLEETFGGLIRVEGLTYDKLRENLTIESADSYDVDRAWRYIKEAASNQQGSAAINR
ncbi:MULTISPECIES: STAS-like domain-containing protein [unclassified Pseudoalteromonas]|uniref:STAS-like domain-containing protein n=1 Tax=unclassified Pseudoalteromonas TaxID=194690 RepID=UPI0016046C99|nr:MULTISPECIES: STAS-like domain-containing protein [unclassified Pseudoalteromonas]MBB1350865.1 STAS-like domain-containing protein [Pseudoalteromonas sp. SG45-3]MBB1359128.1 STAS-like domain-containing protein [Pseudoalteromonas sp. SG45-6]MBB1453979.1 STAS-like domain-containing protein [Pseudoalteromonas sp. SG43-5]